jgi:type IV pilus assembly protein PilE
MKTNNGFTLLELLMVVAVVAVLASISIPAYNDYIVRGKLAEGMSGLSDGRVKMEQYFQDNRTYAAASAAANGCPSATIPVPLTPPPNSTFTYACSNLTATTYTLTATGTGRVLGFVYTIDQTNTKRTTAAPSGWAAATMPTSCWIAKKSGIC